MKHSDVYNKARRSIREKKASELLTLSDTLIKSDDVPAHASGYLMRGMAHELGDDKVPLDLRRAVECYRQAAYLDPSQTTYIFLSRALMKQGQEGYPAAISYLKEASELGNTPELLLAYAKYYETAPTKNFTLAQNCYLRAALVGRFAGFFGYAATSRMLGQHLRAFVADCTRILFGPFLFLFLGRTASKGF